MSVAFNSSATSEMRRLNRLLATLICLFLIGCDSPLEIKRVTAGSEEFKRLPAIMKEFPIWQPIDVPIYDFEVRDGARAPSGGIRYETRLPQEEVFRLVETHLDILNCKPSQVSRQQAHYVCGDNPAQGIELYLEPNTSLVSKVIVLFLQTTPEFEQVSF